MDIQHSNIAKHNLNNELRQERLSVDTVNMKNNFDKVRFKRKCYRFT